jgi:hypothetical protein
MALGDTGSAGVSGIGPRSSAGGSNGGRIGSGASRSSARAQTFRDTAESGARLRREALRVEARQEDARALPGKGEARVTATWASRRSSPRSP